MNGAYCFVDDTVIYKSPIPAAEVNALTSFCHERNLPCILVGEHDICVNQPGELVTEIFNRQLKTDPIPPKPYTDNHSDKEYASCSLESPGVCFPFPWTLRPFSLDFSALSPGVSGAIARETSCLSPEFRTLMPGFRRTARKKPSPWVL